MTHLEATVSSTQSTKSGSKGGGREMVLRRKTRELLPEGGKGGGEADPCVSTHQGSGARAGQPPRLPPAVAPQGTREELWRHVPS